MGGEKTVCPCLGITREHIKEAIRNGASSFKAVKKATGVSTRCGHCKSDAKSYTKKQLKRIGKTAQNT